MVRFFSLLMPVLILAGCHQASHDEVVKNMVSYGDHVKPVVILGGGIAGLTAAMYLQQSNIPTIVIEGPKPGGALGQSHEVNNWPGIYGVTGAKIVDNIKQHALWSGATIIEGMVKKIDCKQYPFVLDIEKGYEGEVETIQTLSCIVAMGTEPNVLGIPGERGEDGYWGRGVSNCAVCDGAFYKNKRVVVIGGGDSAVEQALYLSHLAQCVTVLVRKDAFAAKDKKALSRLLQKQNVVVRFMSSPKCIHGDGQGVVSIDVGDTVKNTVENIEVDGVFLAIGSHPNTDIFKGQLELDARGFIVLKEHQATSVRGIFAAGDIADAQFVQAITAAGDACRAALQVKRFLDS